MQILPSSGVPVEKMDEGKTYILNYNYKNIKCKYIFILKANI